MTLFDWSKNLSPPFNQSDIKLKPGVTWSLAFSRARGWSRNCTLNSHWLLLIWNHRSNSPLWLVWFWPITLNWNVSFDSASWCFILFQFDCTNTLNDQILENVKVEMEPSDGEFEVVTYVPRSSLPYNTPGTTYTLVKLPEDASSGL